MFWNTLIGFCRHIKCSASIFNEIYEFFLSKYLKYPEAVNFGAVFEYLVEALEEWIGKNITEKPTMNDVILDIVALQPNLTLKEIIDKTHKDKNKVKEFLDIHSLGTDLYSTGDILPRRLKNYFKHSLFSISSDGRYNLSLVGLILYLMIRRNRNESRSEFVYENQSKFVYEQLFYKLAQNFSKKLPLIFGKLDLLRKELRSLAVYNFDIVLTSQEKRSEIMSKSILAGGNKELIQNIYSLSDVTNEKLVEVYASGVSALRENSSTLVSAIVSKSKRIRIQFAVH